MKGVLGMGMLIGRWAGRGAVAVSLGVAVSVGGLAAVQPGGAGVSQSKPADKPLVVQDVAQAIRLLDAEGWRQREAAHGFLLRQDPRIRSVLEEELIRTRSAEAAWRLRTIAVHQFLKARTAMEGDMPLLGISLSLEVVDVDGESRPAVVVMGVQPGFPAAEELQAGDRIVGADGDAFEGAYTVDDFRGMVAGKRPGNMLALDVLRGGEVTALRVRLAGIPAGDPANYIFERAQAAAAYERHLAARREKGKRIVEGE